MTSGRVFLMLTMIALVTSASTLTSSVKRLVIHVCTPPAPPTLPPPLSLSPESYLSPLQAILLVGP